MKPRRVLIIVQNLPVPLDRRVWLECKALAAQGYTVSVICPKGPGDPRYQLLDGIAIYKYKPAPEARGVFGFVVEFVWSWLRTAILSLSVRRERGFDVIQACNPPDTYWLLALLWRIRGVRFIFDQHDLNPELYLSRFGEPRSAAEKVQYRGLLWLERMTYRVADRVISTNGSYKAVAERRGHKQPRTVTVVRSGPDTTTMRPVYPDPAIRAGADGLLCYLGIMGPQDGVDTVLTVMHELVFARGRTGLHAVLLGFGDCLEDLKAQCTELGLDGHVRFTGRVGPAEIAQYLSAADIGVGPDHKTPLNDISTMNKTMEYMAYALPSVSFDLVETRVSAGDAAVLVPPGDLDAFADAIERLLDSPEERVAMGLAARERVTKHLDWQPQARAYVGVFDELLGNPPDDDRLARWPYAAVPLSQSSAVEFVDLNNLDEFSRFIRDRSPAATSSPQRKRTVGGQAKARS